MSDERKPTEGQMVLALEIIRCHALLCKSVLLSPEHANKSLDHILSTIAELLGDV